MTSNWMRCSPSWRSNGAGSISWSIPWPSPTRKELKGRYIETTRANFLKTLDISCYSFTAVARRAAALMTTRAAPW